MIRDLWQLAKDSSVYGLGKGILLPLGLVTLPIYTRVFVPAEYGIIALIATITGLIGLFLNLSMESAAQRSYFDSSTKEHKKDVISTGFWFVATWSISIIGIMLLCSEWISSLAFATTQHANLLKIAFIILPITLLIAYCLNALRLHFSRWKFTMITLLNGILSAGLSILFVLRFDMGLMGYFGGALAGATISLVPAIYFIKKDLAFTFSLVRIKEMLSYGIPLVFANFAYYIFFMSDRFFLLKFASLDDVGLYSVAVNFSNIMLLFYVAISLAWSPLAFKLYSESQEMLKNVVIKVLKYSVIFFSFLAVFISTFSRELLHVFTVEAYFGASIAIAPLCLGMIAYASTLVTALGISLSRKTKFIALYAWVAAVVNLGLNALLIPHWGILGAATATAISFTVLTIGFYSASQRLYPIGFNKLAILKICLICLLFVVAGRFIIIDNLILAIFAKLGFILLFMVVTFIVKVLEPDEIAYLRKWFVGLKNVRSIADLRSLVKYYLGG